MSTEHLAAISTSSSQVETETVMPRVDAEKVHTTPSSLVAKVKKEPKDIRQQQSNSLLSTIDDTPTRFCDDNEENTIAQQQHCVLKIFDVRNTEGVDGLVPIIASEEVALIIASTQTGTSIGTARTEDVAISPDGTRLAIPVYHTNTILIARFNVIEDEDKGTVVDIFSANVVKPPDLAEPHGLTFLDDYTIIVANRDGKDGILKERGAGNLSIVHLDKESGMHVIEGHALIDHFHPSVNTPANVRTRYVGARFVEAFVCNTYANHVSRHLLDRDSGWNAVHSEKIIEDLGIPDGVALSNNREWMAISNHASHQIFIFRLTAEMSLSSASPYGVLNNVNAPHGIAFANDDRAMLAADGGLPYIHVYESDKSGDWGGERWPIASKRVMSDEVFNHGRQNHISGGAKVSTKL